jgi:hypothetical protein
VQVNFPASFHRVKVIQHLYDAVILQIEDEEPGLGRFETALAGKIVDDSKDRLLCSRQVFQGPMDRRIVPLDVVLVEDGEPGQNAIAQATIYLVNALQHFGESWWIGCTGRDQWKHEKSVADEANRASGVDDREAHFVHSGRCPPLIRVADWVTR